METWISTLVRMGGRIRGSMRVGRKGHWLNKHLLTLNPNSEEVTLTFKTFKDYCSFEIYIIEADQ